MIRAVIVKEELLTPPQNCDPCGVIGVQPLGELQAALRSLPRVSLRWAFIDPDHRDVLPLLVVPGPYRGRLAVVHNVDDDCFAEPREYTAVPAVMRWARVLMVPPANVTDWRRYLPAANAAMAGASVLLLETTPARLPEWEAMWRSVKGLPA